MTSSLVPVSQVQMDVATASKDQFHFQSGMILLSHCQCHPHNFPEADAAINHFHCEKNSF